MDSLRGTGRTTRILLKALIKISESPEKDVLVFGHNMNYAEVLCRKLYDLCIFCNIPIAKKQLLPRSYQLDFRDNPKNKIIIEDHYINLMRKDNRYVAELPSGIIKNPQMHYAGDDFNVNDVVWLDGDTVYPVYDETKKIYGIIAVNGYRGKPILVAAKN